jgi:hypothetical protein
MSLVLSPNQIPEKSILDHFDRQSYLGTVFTLPVSLTLSNTAETPIALFKSLGMNLKAMFFNFKKVSGVNVTFRFYANPTITSNGTVATPINTRPASPITSTNGIYTAPSVSMNGKLMSQLYSTGQTVIDSELFIFDASQNLLVTAQAVTSSTPIYTTFSWYEL